jgi:protein associated with RNAse G/E
MWKPNDVIAWRGIFKNRIWHAHSTIVVKDTLSESALALLPGAECITDEEYIRYMNGETAVKRRWDYIDKDWVLQGFSWHTNRLLILVEPEKYYSTILFWNDKSNEFLCYYINFQLPIKRSRFGMDTLDLDLDLIVNPDLKIEWKDVNEYQKGIETGIILPEWVSGIERSKQEVLDKITNREYPFDQSWLDWKPDPSWAPPKFPESWYEV